MKPKIRQTGNGKWIVVNPKNGACIAGPFDEEKGVMEALSSEPPKKKKTRKK